MFARSLHTTRFAALLFKLCVLTAGASAQQSRITKLIDNGQRMTLTGHTHPKAPSENDRGRVPPSLTLSYVTLTLAQTESQQADLDKLLAEQQTPGSPNYHRWLTPEQYAQRFGVSEEDLSKIAAWLQGQGLSIAAVARGGIGSRSTARQHRSRLRFKPRFTNTSPMARRTLPALPNPQSRPRSREWSGRFAGLATSG